MKFRCPECLEWVDSEDKICPYCGYDLENAHLKFATIRGLPSSLGPKFKGPVWIYSNNKKIGEVLPDETFVYAYGKKETLKFIFGVHSDELILKHEADETFALSYDRLWGKLTIVKE